MLSEWLSRVGKKSEQYFKKMAPLNLILEMEIGITGGVEDGDRKSVV